MDDSDDHWPSLAAADPALVADVLLRLRRHPPSPPPSRKVPPAAWGLRGKRSRPAPPKDDPSARRASPMTPLNYGGGGSSAISESGSDTAPDGRSAAASPAAAASAAGGRESEVVEGEPLVYRIPDGKPIRRPSNKKQQTMVELEGMERMMLERREILQKEVEGRRRDRAALAARNRGLKRLKLSLESQKMRSTAALMREEVQPKRLRLSDPPVLLPDLNIPLFEELD